MEADHIDEFSRSMCSQRIAHAENSRENQHDSRRKVCVNVRHPLTLEVISRDDGFEKVKRVHREQSRRTPSQPPRIYEPCEVTQRMPAENAEIGNQRVHPA